MCYLLQALIERHRNCYSYHQPDREKEGPTKYRNASSSLVHLPHVFVPFVLARKRFVSEYVATLASSERAPVAILLQVDGVVMSLCVALTNE